jgi:threonine synthase
MKNFSFLSHLVCSQCEKEFSASEPQTFCLSCNSPLLTAYDLKALASLRAFSDFSKRPLGMWRWHELLPLQKEANIVSLGEGDTATLPLCRIASKLKMRHLFLKDEGRNPTHSFKVRGLATTVSKARELGINRLIIPTAGNAGAALATYGCRAGMQVAVYLPKDTPIENIRQCQMSGAEVVLVAGLISDAGVQVRERRKKEEWFDVSTFKEPYRLEGKKVMGFEIAEHFKDKLPDVIIYPTGGGTGLVGIWKAFQELLQLGWLKTDKLPRMVAVQSIGCAPVVSAVEKGLDRCDFWEGATTIAAGLRVPKSFADRLILSTIRDSGGTAIAVSDDAILAAQKELAAMEGIFACPEGAATLAALKQLLASHLIRNNDRVLLLNTGSGLTNMAMLP